MRLGASTADLAARADSVRRRMRHQFYVCGLIWPLAGLFFALDARLASGQVWHAMWVGLACGLPLMVLPWLANSAVCRITLNDPSVRACRLSAVCCLPVALAAAAAGYLAMRHVLLPAAGLTIATARAGHHGRDAVVLLVLAPAAAAFGPALTRTVDLAAASGLSRRR